MKDVYYNDTPLAGRDRQAARRRGLRRRVRADDARRLPLQDLGKVTVTAATFGPGGTIPAGAIDVGYVSYRLSRVTMEGSVYTISPRLDHAARAGRHAQGRHPAVLADGQGRPADAKPGSTGARSRSAAEQGGTLASAVEFRVRTGTLDPVDIPAGPWGYTIDCRGTATTGGRGVQPRDGAEEPAEAARVRLHDVQRRARRSPTRASRTASPSSTSRAADEQMKTGQGTGFLAVVTYGGGVSRPQRLLPGHGAMRAAGFKDYAGSSRPSIRRGPEARRRSRAGSRSTTTSATSRSATTSSRSAENAEAYRKAFPKGPPFFTAATSFRATTATTRTSASPRPCTSPTGTATTRRRSA